MKEKEQYMSTQQDTQQKTFRFMVFFERMFKNLHRLIFTNALFFAPLVLWLAIFYFIGELTGFRQSLLLSCAVITAFPFYSGVAAVTRDIARGQENVDVFKTFFKSVKSDGWSFLLYGVLAFLAFWMSFFSVTFYSRLAKNTSPLFYGILFICILVIILVFFAFYYVPVMTVTYKLNIRHVLKNSFLMALGEIKANLLTTLGLVCLSAILFSISIFCNNVLALQIFVTAVMLLVVPSIPSMIINFGVYEPMNKAITQSAKLGKEIDEKIDKTAAQRKKEVAVSEEDFSDININELSDTDEYIFHNGKMVKQSVLLAKLKEMESEKKDEN